MGKQMSALSLNGRSYTDVLAPQSGAVPVTSLNLTSGTTQDVGVSAFSPSGDLNPGTVSIIGQREFANSFVLNGSDVEEDVNMGAAIVPNLDSIAESFASPPPSRSRYDTNQAPHDAPSSNSGTGGRHLSPAHFRPAGTGTAVRDRGSAANGAPD